MSACQWVSGFGACTAPAAVVDHLGRRLCEFHGAHVAAAGYKLEPIATTEDAD